MKVIQKLEILCGVATLTSTLLSIITLLYSYLEHSHFGKDIFATDKIIQFGVFSSLLITFSSIIAASAYNNAVKQINQKIAAICISGFLISVIFVPISLVFFAYGAVVYGLLIITPTIFSIATMILALFSRKKSYV